MPAQTFKTRNKEISISKDGLKYQDSWTTYESKSPVAFRYGIKPIQLELFNIGTVSLIQILSESNEKISIPLKSFFGINRKKLWATYNAVIDSLWDHFFTKMYGDLIDQYNSGKDLDFEGKYQITENGLYISSKKKIIEFEDMVIKEDFEFFSVNSRSDSKLYTNIYYLGVWNSYMLFSILKSILKVTN